MVWHTEQPAFVKISVIGSSPVTSGTMSGASTAAEETGAGVTEEGLMERRENNVPNSSTITMRGVKARSGMEPVAGKVRQPRNLRTQHGGLAIYSIANLRRPAQGHCDSHFDTSMAQRNPIVRSSKSGSAENRAVTRNADGKSAHDPPRNTRFSPTAGPSGFLPGLF